MFCSTRALMRLAGGWAPRALRSRMIARKAIKLSVCKDTWEVGGVEAQSISAPRPYVDRATGPQAAEHSGELLSRKAQVQSQVAPTLVQESGSHCVEHPHLGRGVLVWHCQWHQPEGGYRWPLGMLKFRRKLALWFQLSHAVLSTACMHQSAERYRPKGAYKNCPKNCFGFGHVAGC